MIITNKTKFKEAPKISLITSVSETDLIKEISKFNVPEKIGKYKVKHKYEVSFSDITEFWDAKTEEDIIIATSKAFIGVNHRKEIDKLPFIDFMRLMIEGKDAAKEFADRLEKIKHTPSLEELQAGIEKIKGDKFKLIRNWMKISSLEFDSFEDAYNYSWGFIIKELEAEFEQNWLQKNLHEVMSKKHK